MQVALDDQEIIARVAALDIGKAEVVCCVRVPGQGPRARRMQEVRTYTTMTRSLLAMADWLTCWSHQDVPGRTVSADRQTPRQETSHRRGRQIILIIVWELLSDEEKRFIDLGPGYYDSRVNRNHSARNHVRELQALGDKVTLEPAA